MTGGAVLGEVVSEGLVLEALILAAGAGRRFGGDKLLTPWRAGVLLDGSLATALAAPVRAVTLVTGHSAEAVAAAARRLEPGPRLRIIHAERHAEGMGASLAGGIITLTDDVDGVLVFLGDMPLVPVAAAQAVAAALQAGAVAAAPTFQGVRGHPAGFSRSQFAALAALVGDRGGGAILAALGADVVYVPCADDGILRDVDQPGDLPG